jgi:phage terminase small subunit
MPRLKRASFKEKSFAAEYIKARGDGGKAVLNSAYNASTGESARQMAKQLLNKPRVQEEINKILELMQLDPRSLAKISKKIITQSLGPKGSLSTAASHTEFLYKVQGIAPITKNMSLNVSKAIGSEIHDFTQLQEDVRKMSESMNKLLNLADK